MSSRGHPTTSGSLWGGPFCKSGVGRKRDAAIEFTQSLIKGLLRAPPKPGQVRILAFHAYRASRLLSLALFPTGVFLAPLNLLRLLPVSFCNSRFSCSSDGTLLCVATRMKSPIACWLHDPSSSVRRTATTLSLHGVSCCLNREHGWWTWNLVQPYGCECPGRTHDLPYSTLAGEYLPLRSPGSS